MKRIVKYQLLILFFGILLLPVLNSSFKIVEFERKSENRVFRDSLTIGIDRLDAFPEECEEYVNDNFPFRSPLLSVYQRIKYAINSSPYPDKIIVGKNGWLFNAGIETEIYRGRIDFTADELEDFSTEWEKRKAYFDSKEIKFYWVICPIKHNIYDEMLPFSIRPSSDGKRVDQVKNYLNKRIPGFIIDPSEELIKEKKNSKVFYELDNHWNYKAGYITTEMLLKRIRKDFPDKKIPSPDVEWYDSVLNDFGFQRGVIGIDELFELSPFHHIKNEQSFETKKHGFTPPYGFPYPWEYERVFSVNKNINGLKILVIRDSFGQLMMPFLKEAFNESVFLFDAWQYGMNEDIIDKVNPDIVIYQSVETYLESFIGKEVKQQ